MALLIGSTLFSVFSFSGLFYFLGKRAGLIEGYKLGCTQDHPDAG